MNNDWTDILRDKLAEHEMTPPAGLWEEIEGKMGLPAETPIASVSPQSRRGLWISTAAACAVLLIGLSLFFKFGETGKSEEQTASSGNSTEQTFAQDDSKTETNFPETTEDIPLSVDSTGTISNSQKQKPLLAKVVGRTEIAEKSENTADEKKTETKTESKSLPASEQNTEQTTERNTEPQVINKLLEQEHYAQNFSRKKSGKKRGGLSANLYAANLPTPSLGGAENSTNDFMYDSQGDPLETGKDSTSNRSIPRSLAKSNEIIKAKHQRPIRAGISLAYPLTDRLDLTSGLSFSILKSDFTRSYFGFSYTEEQKLTYIGIPLGVSYKVLEYKAVSLYLSAGGMVEQCIAGNAVNTKDGSKGRETRPQFSAFGGAGLQVALGKYLSLFAEPRLSYYSDNHSGVENYYKENPATFDLNFGVRVNFTR